MQGTQLSRKLPEGVKNNFHISIDFSVAVKFVLDHSHKLEPIELLPGDSDSFGTTGGVYNVASLALQYFSCLDT